MQRKYYLGKRLKDLITSYLASNSMMVKIWTCICYIRDCYPNLYLRIQFKYSCLLFLLNPFWFVKQYPYMQSLYLFNTNHVAMLSLVHFVCCNRALELHSSGDGVLYMVKMNLFCEILWFMATFDHATFKITYLCHGYRTIYMTFEGRITISLLFWKMEKGHFSSH